MKKTGMLVCLALALAMSLALPAGCNVIEADLTAAVQSGDDSSNSTQSGVGQTTSPGQTDGGQTDGGLDEGIPFSYSEGIDENGFWEGVKALDYVTMFDYGALQIPNDIHFISSETLQSEIDYLLSEFPAIVQIMDRTVANGDTVNIDFVGSVDGVPFDRGSTNGLGEEVIIGETNYIDDFLEQLIGHMPGDVVNVEVTFPDDYGEVSLQGKDALFVTTINFIVEEGEIELTDDYVVENLSIYYGWTTVEEMESEIRSTLEKNALQQYIQQYFTTQVPVSSIPESLLKYQERALLDYYQGYTLYYYGIELEDFLVFYQGFSGIDEFVEMMYEDIRANAIYYLVIQAVAEDAGFSISSDDLSEFFLDTEGTSDYSSFEEEFGLPYLKQFLLCQKVTEYIMQNAILL